MDEHGAPLEGRCTCGAVRYRLTAPPLFVHCCHCSWCRRESGSAFAVNALIESDRLVLAAGAPETVTTPSASGRGQKVVRCRDCRVALWSHYAGSGDPIAFVRVGTLGEPHGVAPDVHIFTSTKLPWVVLPDSVPAFPGYYRLEELWPAASLERRARALGR